MTTQAVAALPVRTVRDARLAGLAGVVAPLLTALAWSLLASAVRGAGLRVPGVAWWALWSAFAAGVVRSAGVGAASVRQHVLLLFIASSALGFRFGARR